jgi:hypothetical protein
MATPEADIPVPARFFNGQPGAMPEDAKAGLISAWWFEA